MDGRVFGGVVDGVMSGSWEEEEVDVVVDDGTVGGFDGFDGFDEFMWVIGAGCAGWMLESRRGLVRGITARGGVRGEEGECEGDVSSCMLDSSF